MIEELLQELNTNLKALTAAVKAAGGTATSAGAATSGKATGGKASTGKAATKTTSKSKAKASASVTKKQVADMVLKVVSDVSRDAAVEVLAAHGVGKVTDLDEGDYDDVYAELKAKLDEAAEEEPEEEEDDDGLV